MGQDVYTISQPDIPKAGIVVNSAHSGRYYPDAFIQSSQLSVLALRSSEDAFVDQLFSAAPALGIPMLAAIYPRAYVDLNRASDELDPALIHGLSHDGLNPRVASGLGVIPRVVAEGRVIRRGKMNLINAKTRLARYYWPYHQQLSHMMDAAHAHFGEAIMLDCHSMPSHAGTSNAIGYDVILGDRFGASASGLHVDVLESLFADAGFRVGRNAPFAGAYIAQRYGQPAQGRNVIQIEINRGLYLDEHMLKVSAGFEKLRAALSGIMAQFIQHASPSVGLAAE